MNITNSTPVTGELLELDTALNELYDYAIEHSDNTSEDGTSYRFLQPADTDDMYRTIWYDIEQDDFVDIFGGVIMRESWIQDHELWLVMQLH